MINVILGLTIMNGACRFYEHNKYMSATSIVKDNNGYSGILTAAHELGHSYVAK